ncbi:hypothetical protein BGW38_004732 [Lunasporangiospora selenospora]|uniref:Dolichyl-phosphate-mannose--protein mannosyltransferase n=1 Tax=Lunasporangiospora selenospora TaxID=979761 RepID=A0A9P6FNW7_9FUNG|nr:hypothetical protein BGW38_004732 [Lunasporangiospora selenospora]
MRNGASSAVDQTGVPVYRGSTNQAPASESSSSTGSELHGGHDADNVHHKARTSLEMDSSSYSQHSQQQRKQYGLGAEDDHDDTHLAKFRSRRRVAWYKSRDFQISSLITAVAFVVRLWAIGFPTSVVFDEVHFGGFASKYIRGRFFMDVHPPLAKMLITLTGWLFGLDPNFNFGEIGLDYLVPKVPYIPMRLMCGLMGVAVVPMAYYTVRNSENATVTQSRLILLDAPLILFTAFTVLSWVNFHNERVPFSDSWLVWLLLTGVGLGLSGSVKWVGLFIIATIGFSTLKQLWELWGDLRVTPSEWLRHFMARAAFLIVIPTLVYMLMFEIHFLLLGGSGEGDGFMSAPFQMTLGHSLEASPLSISYGARVSIRHVGTQGGYLHSHASVYETGSKQQQITLYPHKDENNDWIIQKRDGSIPEELEFIKHGDYIRLLHISTDKRLHSHEIKAPMTEDENHFEVSGYGHKGFDGDANDEWRVEIVEYDGKHPDSETMLHTLRTRFKLVHMNMNCDLFSHNVKLPKWGFEQQEVTCMRSAVLKRSTWTVESNKHDQYTEEMPKVNYIKPSFLSKFLELNKVMWVTNAGLTASHPYDSKPSSWFWLRRGISFWGQSNKHIYLMGNWFTWYLSSFSVALYVVIRALLFVRDKRGYRDDFRGNTTFDLACRFIPNRFRLVVLVLISSYVIYVFKVQAPITYGLEWTRDECEASKVLKTWDYDCNQFPGEYSHYLPAPVQADPLPPTEPHQVIGGALEDLAKNLQAEQGNVEGAATEGEGVVDATQDNGADSSAAKDEKVADK